MPSRASYISLTWAVTAVTAVTAAAGSTATADDYVALGDSFSSEVGTGSYTLSRSCRRGVYAYPYRVAQQRPNTSLRFVACSGATTASVMSTQIRAVRSTTKIVTITIGGNDIGFVDLAFQCTLDDCSSALDARRTALPRSLNAKLDTVYGAIRTRAAPDARVVVLGYPRMFTNAVCPAAAGISVAERTKANQLADALDRTIPPARSPTVSCSGVRSGRSGDMRSAR